MDVTAPTPAPHAPRSTEAPDRSAASAWPLSSWARIVAAVLVRPWLWWSALRLVVRAAPRGWWKRAPFVPLPDAAWVHFRTTTAFGTSGRPSARDLVDYLEWCRRSRLG